MTIVDALEVEKKINNLDFFFFSVFLKTSGQWGSFKVYDTERAYNIYEWDDP